MKKFIEKQTRDFYNGDDMIYRSFWDQQGNCHWGYFPNVKISFLQSMTELNKKMLKLSGITEKSNVLDLGCGNGNNTYFINSKTGARVTGIDLSDTRIENAKKVLSRKSSKVKSNIKFHQGTAILLPFKDKTFSAVWSQATMYHVHDKAMALKEVARVLKKDGVFIFDDLIKPNKNISPQAKKLVYERLLFDTDFDFVSYQQELKNLRFRIMYAEDMSWHYAMSYKKLADIAEEKIKKGENKEFHEEYKKLIVAYRQTWKIMEKGDVGWALFICKKL
ncbi:MAG: methyltransferase domain-containing protein [Patescibacteria group bacterium]|mgnify:CR=1 FL=1